MLRLRLPPGRTISRRAAALVGLVVLASWLLVAWHRSAASVTRSPSARISGAGATLPAPLLSRWTRDYARAFPQERVSYQSVGSGAGIRQTLDGSVDFGVTERPLSDAELRRAGRAIVHVPVTVGAIAVAYHLDGLDRPLAFDAETLAAAFMGTIRRWNDPRIATLNPGLSLPDAPIHLVYRADASGTTAAFTAYLQRGSATWRARIGSGTHVRFSKGTGVSGNEGASALIKSTPLTLGYVEQAYAKASSIQVAALENPAGRFVLPSSASAEAAAHSLAAEMPSDLRQSLIDAPGEDAYPVAAYSYVLAPRETPDRSKATVVARFLWWATHEGQRDARSMGYAPLPSAVARRAEDRLHELESRGTPVLLP